MTVDEFDELNRWLDDTCTVCGETRRYCMASGVYREQRQAEDVEIDMSPKQPLTGAMSKEERFALQAMALEWRMAEANSPYGLDEYGTEICALSGRDCAARLEGWLREQR